MNLLTFFKTKDQIDSNDATRRTPRRPNPVDWTNNYTANSELTRGLYHNTFPGFKLAGGLAFPPIAVPAWFMGLPTPAPKDDTDEVTADELNQLVERFSTELQQIHIQAHREGTVWVWPHWSARGNRLIWEFIPDESVIDIIRDLDTGDITEIITNEQITIKVGEEKTVTVERKRIFTRERVTVQWKGASALPDKLADRTMRNPLRIMPVAFANNQDGQEVRGYSDYTRILSDLKNYHDIDLAWSRMLAKFSPKMIQQVRDVDQWLANNGWAKFTDIDIEKTDMILNLTEQETTDFAWPQGAHEAYGAALKKTFRKIIEASGVPEIVWGLKTEGNRASVEESMDSLIKYVHDKQAQKNKPYLRLFSDSLRIMRFATLGNPAPEIEIGWNQLDAVSDEVRSIIFRNFAQGVAAIVGGAAGTKEQLHSLWMKMYPDATDDDYDVFKVGLSDMGAHNQWRNADFMQAMDFQGLVNDPDNDNGSITDDE